MKMNLRAVPVAALVALAAASGFDAAKGNHYILPCPPDCRDVADIAIGPGFTGTWTAPAANAHRISIEVLPGQPLQMFALWFVFGPQGGQSWITGHGPIAGNRAVLQASQTVGGGAQFPPNFDPASVHEQTWGTLTFTFSDCDNGHVDWASIVPGYGSGGMDLIRLTMPAGLVCRGESGGTAKGAGSGNGGAANSAGSTLP